MLGRSVTALVAATLAVAITAAVAIMAPPAPATARTSAPARTRGGLPTVLAGPGPLYRIRPQAIYYTGDDSGVIGVLRPHLGPSGSGRGRWRWTSWTATQAAGTGTLWLKLGTPIATSRFTRVNGATVLLRNPRNGRFTRLLLQYRLQGQIVNDDRCIPSRGKVAEWSVLVGAKCL